MVSKHAGKGQPPQGQASNYPHLVRELDTGVALGVVLELRGDDGSGEGRLGGEGKDGSRREGSSLRAHIGSTRRIRVLPNRDVPERIRIRLVTLSC